MIKIQKLETLKRARRGISLYELLIVMSIIALVAAITVPTVNYYLPSLKLSSSARVVSSKLRQAQEEAVTTQIRHLIRFDPMAVPPTLQLIKKEAAGTETVLETVALGQGITLTIDAVFQDPVTHYYEVIFSSDGGPSASGDITINLDTASKTINISSAGVIKLLSAASSPLPTPSPTPTPTPTSTPTPSPSPTPTPTPSYKTPYPSPSYVTSPTPTPPPEP